MKKIKVVTVVLVGLFLFAFCQTALAVTNEIERISVATDGTQGNWTSQSSVLSGNARRVVFWSRSTNLDPSGNSGIFVRDRETGVTKLIPGGGGPESFSISADGQYIAYLSDHIYLYDIETDTAKLIDAAPDGTPGNWNACCGSGNPIISADGRFVTFFSYSSNLVQYDTNGAEDVFVYSRETGILERVNISSSGEQSNGSYSVPFSISSDGRYVVFGTNSSNFDLNNTNGMQDMYIRDRINGTTERTGTNFDGLSGGIISAASISADGRYVAFSLGISSFSFQGSIVYIKDRKNGTFKKVSNGAFRNNSLDPFISSDGRYVVYNSGWMDVSTREDLFVYDNQTETTKCISPASNGSGGYEYFRWPSISADNKYITFSSNVASLVPNDTNESWDVFLVKNPLYDGPVNIVPPTLTNPTDSEYKDDGINPNKGVANKDLLTFKTIYTDTENATPTKMDVVIRNTVDFDTDFYGEQFTLSDHAIVVQGSDINERFPQKTKFVGNDNWGNAITGGESVTATLKRENIYQATTTVVVDLYKVVIGEVSADIVLEALDANGVVMNSKKLSVLSDSDVSQIKRETLSITSENPIFGLRVLAEATHNAHVLIEKIDLGEKLPMVVDTAVATLSFSNGNFNDGEQYTTSSKFPKGKYDFNFEASDGEFATSTEVKTFTTGYSNIAFLPGIKASRLFVADGSHIDGEDQLWEPNVDTDTQDLLINSNGSSTNPNIYTKSRKNENEDGGVIDEAFGFTVNVYETFLFDLKKWKAEDVIQNYGVLAYDWRLAFSEVLNGGKDIDGKVYFDDSYPTDKPYIFQKLRDLAETSDNGKVTIVAHSMGGMLAKKLLHDIQEDPNHPYRDLLSKVEIVILVDSPQLGTPQAIATLLNGTNEELGVPLLKWPKFTKDATVRAVAYDMPSVYTLLPSSRYMSRVHDDTLGYTVPILLNQNLRNVAADKVFNATTTFDYFNLKYGTTTITTIDTLDDFLAGKDGHASSTVNDTIHPNAIRADLIIQAQNIHDEIDNWTPPDGIKVVQIAGWGIPKTIRGVEYKEKNELRCNLPASGNGMGAAMPSCIESKSEFNNEPMFTFDGDGTVVVPSQIAMKDTFGVDTYYVDLNDYNYRYLLGMQINRDHASILEVDSVRTLIKNINNKIINPEEGLQFIKKDSIELNPKGLKKFVRLSLHSPVNADIFDNAGRHVGISASSIADNMFYDTQMPNSYYLKMGEGKYLGFQLEASTTIQLQGTGSGTFTFELEQYQGDELEGAQTFTNIPVSTSTKAVLIMSTLDDAKELKIDYDGDGTVDFIVFTEETKKTVTFQTLKDGIQKLLLGVQPALLNQTVTAEKQFIKGNNKTTNALLLVLRKETEKLLLKKNTKIQQENILRVLATVQVLIEKTN
jgi:pimeloyl-ACP methyl ester carboxylesterase